MSWSYSATATRDGMGDALTVAENACPFSDDVTASRDQSSAARIAALIMLDSDAVGGDDRQFVVALSGHANPGHAPRDGWANDTVTISISQLAANIPVTAHAEQQSSADASNQAPGVSMADPSGGNEPVPANTSDYQRAVQPAGAAAATDQMTNDLNAVAAQTGEPQAPAPQRAFPPMSPDVSEHPQITDAATAEAARAADRPTATSTDSDTGDDDDTSSDPDGTDTLAQDGPEPVETA